MPTIAPQSDKDQAYTNHLFDFPSDLFDSKFNVTQPRLNEMSFYSYDDASNADVVGANGVPGFQLPISPNMSGNDMFFDASHPMHVNPVAVWNGSEKPDMMSGVDMSASQDLAGAKALTDYAGSTTRHFGQITPPSENDDDNAKESTGRRADSGVGTSLATDRASNVSSRSSSKSQKSSKARTSSAEAQLPKRARTKENIEDDEATGDVEEIGIGDGTRDSGNNRREKYREKNRVAAAKCRAKKKDHVDNLEETHRTQSVLNTALKQTEKSLRDELSFWRTQALQHTFCSCRPIQDYNMRKAQNLAAESMLGNPIVNRSPSMNSSSSMAQSPATQVCAAHPSRSQSVSGPGQKLSPNTSTSMDSRHRSFAAPSSRTAFQPARMGQSHNRHFSESTLQARPLSSTDEQELKKFVNDVIE